MITKGSNTFNYRAKLIDSKYKNSIIASPDDILIEAELDSVHSDHSLITKAKVERSTLEYSVIHATDVFDSKLYGSTAMASHIVDTDLENSTVYGTGIIGSKLDDVVATKAFIKDSILNGAIIEEGVRLYGVESDIYGLYFKQGSWTRAPYTVEIEHLRYLISEDVNDKILIGCQSRSFEYWINLTIEQAAKFGQEFEDNFVMYRAAVIEVNDWKQANFHKVVLAVNEKPITDEWSLSNEKQNETNVSENSELAEQ